jgi:hypothetical protein
MAKSKAVVEDIGPGPDDIPEPEPEPEVEEPVEVPEPEEPVVDEPVEEVDPNEPAGVVIQEEPRWEAMGEVGPYMVMEVNGNGGVLSTAYYATHDEATEFANSVSDTVNDETEELAAAEAEASAETEETV